MTMALRSLVTLSCAAALTGCLSRNPAVELRTFLPEPTAVRVDEGAGQPSDLRLERVDARGHLRTPMVWRLSEVELFIDEANSWAREPAGIVEEWLQAALFASGAFAPQELRPAPVLSVRVESFEGVLEGVRRARLRLSAVLRRPDGSVAAWRSFETEEPLERRGADALARALGIALERTTQAVRDWAAAAR